MFFFFNDTATTEIYTLSLHDALPISQRPRVRTMLRIHQSAKAYAPEQLAILQQAFDSGRRKSTRRGDRKSTRLNSSHLVISYAVFCLKKKTALKKFPGKTDYGGIMGS